MSTFTVHLANLLKENACNLVVILAQIAPVLSWRLATSYTRSWGSGAAPGGQDRDEYEGFMRPQVALLLRFFNARFFVEVF